MGGSTLAIYSERLSESAIVTLDVLDIVDTVSVTEKPMSAPARISGTSDHLLRLVGPSLSQWSVEKSRFDVGFLAIPLALIATRLWVQITCCNSEPPSYSYYLFGKPPSVFGSPSNLIPRSYPRVNSPRLNAPFSSIAYCVELAAFPLSIIKVDMRVALASYRNLVLL